MVNYLVFGKEEVDSEGVKRYRNLLFILADKFKDAIIEQNILGYTPITKFTIQSTDIHRIIPMLKTYANDALTKEQIVNIVGEEHGRRNYIVGVTEYGFYDKDTVTDILVISGCSSAKEAKEKYIKIRGEVPYEFEENSICIKVPKHIHVNRLGFKRRKTCSECTTHLLDCVSVWNEEEEEIKLGL